MPPSQESEPAAPNEPPPAKERVVPEAVFEAVRLPMKPTVQGLEVLEAEGLPESQPNQAKPTPLQQAGLKLALGVGLAIAAATLFVLFDYFQTRPIAPRIPDFSTAQAKTAIENFKALNDVNLDRATRVFDLVVVKAFLPVFTAILGYIFGSREESRKVENKKNAEKPELV
jgi:hypothetical protein